MSDAQNKISYINSLKSTDFMLDEAVKKAFIKNNMQIGGASQTDAELFYEKESMYLRRVIHESWNPEKPNTFIGRCTTFSLYAAFMDLAIYGEVLTLNPKSKLAYIETRNYKAGRDEGGNDRWESRASLAITPYGEAAIRIDLGQIRYYDPVIVVYEGDFFEIGTDERSNTVVIWKSKIPRASKKIIGSFVKITRPDGSFITPYMLQEDIDRLAAYSNRNNRGKGANELYGNAEAGTGIDSGFLKAKTLKFGIANFGKFKLKGNNSSLEPQEDERDDYAGDAPMAPGYVPPAPVASPQVAPRPAAEVRSQSSDPFAPGYVAPAADYGRGDDWDKPQTPSGGTIKVTPLDDDSTF